VIFLFSKSSRRALGSTQPPIQWASGFFPGRKVGGVGVNLTTHLPLVSRQKMTGTTCTRLFSPFNFMARTGKAHSFLSFWLQTNKSYPRLVHFEIRFKMLPLYQITQCQWHEGWSSMNGHRLWRNRSWPAETCAVLSLEGWAEEVHTKPVSLLRIKLGTSILQIQSLTTTQSS
jgi:hypothetical protein